MSLKEIAQMTGVSVSTVGRILNDPKHRCSNEQVRKKVLEAAREINYIPNANARNLKSGGSMGDKIYSVNILLTRFSSETADPFYDELLMQLEKELRNSGCIIANVWHNAEFSDEKASRSETLTALVDSLYDENSQRHDGLIIIGNVTRRALRVLKTREKNIVSINRNTTNYEVDEVLCDGKRIAREAVLYLARLGHTKIAYVGDCHNESRFAGFQAALADMHLAPDIDYVFDTSPNEHNGLIAYDYFRSLAVPPTAVYCANDILAIGFINAFGKRRQKQYLPSVISSDDIDAAQYTKPMLTTISLPKADMVRFALMLLLDRIKGGHKIVSRIELEGTLMIRESCRNYSEVSEPEYYI